MRMPLISLVLIGSITAFSCGPKIDTGRNENPNQWQNGDSNNTGADPHSGSGESDSGNSEGNDKPGAHPSGNQVTKSSCFKTTSKDLSVNLKKICSEYIQPNSFLSKVSQYICVDGYLTPALTQPKCGWQGNAANIEQFIHVYEREPETSGNDYEDIHATMVHAPVSASKFLEFVRLAFEDYAGFKARGFQWISGTRDTINLNAGKFDSGILYRFLVDTASYDLAYSGRIQLFQIDEKTWLHVNYADHDFKRVKLFEQAVFYHDVGDGSSLILKFEHKAVESKGLYRIARNASTDMMQDFMKKSWSNALKGK